MCEHQLGVLGPDRSLIRTLHIWKPRCLEVAISSLKPADIRVIDDLVDFYRGRGYVLDFSDRTFSEFFAAELDIDIYDPAFGEDGTSKGSHLRCFLRKVDDGVALRALQALWAHRKELIVDWNLTDTVPRADVKFERLVAKLQGEVPIQPQNPLVPRPAQEVIQELRTNLYEIRNLLPQQRGYEFERFLTKCFAISGLEPRNPFRNVGEQIDGSFVLDGETYLVEAKWVVDRVGNRDLHAFHGKLDGKAQWARGLFVSYHGFTEEGLVSFGTGKKAICMEGRDFYDALERCIPLREVLERKVRHAAETGFPFVTVEQLYGSKAE